MGVNNECPPSCCVGDELLCIGIPCPIDIVILGLQLRLELPCVRLTSGTDLTPEQVQQLIGVLVLILQNIGNLPDLGDAV